MTTWRIGGPAAYLARPQTPTELADDLAAARELGLPVLALGAGSNLLFPDEGYPGLVLRLPAEGPRDDAGGPLARAPAPGPARADQRIWLAAGTPLPRLVRALARLGWGGLEWACGIPGTVGGAVVNNAGAYGAAMADRLEVIESLGPDGTPRRLRTADLEPGYRHTRLKGAAPSRAFLLRAAVRLTPAEPDALAARCTELRALRRARTPRGPSCGSVFRNPPGDAAGRLIDAAGLRGTRIGDAQIANRHANYIINRGAASAAQVLSLIDLVRRRVHAEAGVALDLEVQLVGLTLDPI
jgi:UDP-N-acetylmuramate dehydrogenase